MKFIFVPRLNERDGGYLELGIDLATNSVKKTLKQLFKLHGLRWQICENDSLQKDQQ